MEQFDYIINRLSKKVKITSSPKILESYKIKSIWFWNGFKPEKEDITREFKEGMREMGRIFIDNINWLSEPNDLVFLEGDKVIVDLREISMMS